MADKAQRKELLARYKQSRPEAGVYRIVNQRSHRVLIGSSPNLASVRSKVDFARATNTPSALDHRLLADARQLGLDVFQFEVLEVMDVAPDATDAQIAEDLSALEALWREKQDAALLY
jgi:hypothetical protein